MPGRLQRPIDLSDFVCGPVLARSQSSRISELSREGTLVGVTGIESNAGDGIVRFFQQLSGQVNTQFESELVGGQSVDMLHVRIELVTGEKTHIDATPFSPTQFWI